jgi:hypothetical protein
MTQIDAQLEEMARKESGDNGGLLEYCPARTDLLRGPWRFLPLAVPALAILSLVTGLGVLALFAGLLLVGLVVYFAVKYKNYLLVLTETHLILIPVSGNLLTKSNAPALRFRYEELHPIQEYGSGRIGILPRTGAAVKLLFHYQLRKLTSGPVRMAKILRTLRVKVPPTAAPR